MRANTFFITGDFFALGAPTKASHSLADCVKVGSFFAFVRATDSTVLHSSESGRGSGFVAFHSRSFSFVSSTEQPFAINVPARLAAALFRPPGETGSPVAGNLMRVASKPMRLPS